MKRGGKNQSALTLDDLNEEILDQRLKKLESELIEFKQKCVKYKNENEWYRNEIETSQQDTAYYIAYLEAKKLEKASAIDELIRSNQTDLEDYMARRQAHEQENNQKIAGIGFQSSTS
ncbi:hypothetical protein EDD86DRAFT_219765 [Gorgonomyces haynaldii]|nr:hypothetical protein EDD86DRAFT_219765 [Gorgonomyces haynaldii]